MNIEVGYFPKSYYGSKPDEGDFFPFALDGETNYVFAISEISLPECGNAFLPLWLTNIKAFPIYCCAEVSHFWQDDFEQICTASNIRFDCIDHGRDRSIFVSRIKNEKQLKAIFPYYSMLGIANDLVLWSSNKNVFSVEKREWTGVYEGSIRKTVVVKMDADTSVFWIGYDGDYIAVISNQSHFSTYEKIIKAFPGFVAPKPFKYE